MRLYMYKYGKGYFKGYTILYSLFKKKIIFPYLLLKLYEHPPIVYIIYLKGTLNTRPTSGTCSLRWTVAY